MGSVSLPTMAIIMAATTAVSAGVSMYESHEQGVARANADKAKARQEQLSETQKQISMRQNMLKSLASQNAGTLGAVGTGRGTSFGANSLRQINEAQNDVLVSRANASGKISMLDADASNARAAGDIQAVGTFMSNDNLGALNTLGGAAFGKSAGG